YATSPNSVSLAIRIASSSVLNRNNEATGPKVSSRAINASAGTSASTVGSQNKSLITFPPVSTRAPLSTASAICVSPLSRPFLLINGPICTPSSRPFPTFKEATAVVNRDANASKTASATKKRFTATQVCPAFRNLANIAPSTAASKSASSNTIKGALPPNSNDSFFTWVADCFINSFPTAVDPVNDNFLIKGCVLSSYPIADASVPVTT